MAQWIVAIIQFVTALAMLYGYIRLSGKSEAKLEARFKAVEDALERHEEKLTDTESRIIRHQYDTDIHWTPRERNDLARKLDEMGMDIKTLLARKGDK